MLHLFAPEEEVIMGNSALTKATVSPVSFLSQDSVSLASMNSMKLVIPLHSLYWSIHTKDESKRGTAFAFIFGVN